MTIVGARRGDVRGVMQSPASRIAALVLVIGVGAAGASHVDCYDIEENMPCCNAADMKNLECPHGTCTASISLNEPVDWEIVVESGYYGPLPSSGDDKWCIYKKPTCDSTSPNGCGHETNNTTFNCEEDHYTLGDPDCE